MPDQTAGSKGPTVERVDGFISIYTNNIQVHQSFFDVKLICGDFEQLGPSQGVIKQHSSVIMSWLQAKLLLYYLRVNMTAFESQYGKIDVPNELLPVPIVPLPKNQENDPKARAIWQQLHALREEFVRESAK